MSDIHRALVRDYMNTRVHTVRADQDVVEVVCDFVKRHVTGAPVVDERGNLLGMLSDTDCIGAAMKAGYDPQWRGTVAEFMTTDVETVNAEDSVMSVAERFMTRRYRRFPVVQDNQLVGLISRLEVLRVLSDQKRGFA